MFDLLTYGALLSKARSMPITILPNTETTQDHTLESGNAYYKYTKPNTTTRFVLPTIDSYNRDKLHTAQILIEIGATVPTGIYFYDGAVSESKLINTPGTFAINKSYIVNCVYRPYINGGTTVWGWTINMVEMMTCRA